MGVETKRMSSSVRWLAPGIVAALVTVGGFAPEVDAQLARGAASVEVGGTQLRCHLKHTRAGMPQDIRVSPDGKVFFVADVKAAGVFVIDGASFTEIGLHQDGDRHPRALPEPGRHQALHRQPRLPKTFGRVWARNM